MEIEVKKIFKWYQIHVEDKNTLIKLFIIVSIVWGLNLAAIFIYGEFGTKGDSFGVVNTLFSGLAFGGIIYSIFLQQKELREQNVEFKEQNKVMEQQKFETTFFNLMQTIEQTKKNTAVTALYQQSTDGVDLVTVPLAFKKYYAALKKDATLQFEFLEQHLKQYPFIISYVEKSKVEDKDFYLNYIKIRMLKSEAYFLLAQSLLLNLAEYNIIIRKDIIPNSYFDEKPFIYHKELYEGAAERHSKKTKSP